MPKDDASQSSAPQRSPWGPALRHRNFRYFAGGQAISQTGTWMQYTAMAWLTYELGHSTFVLGLVAFAGQIPTFFLAPIAGVLSDRLNRRQTILLLQWIAMLQAGTLSALVWTRQINQWEIIAFSLILGIISAFEVPLRHAFVADLVDDREDLPGAIAINSAIVNGSRLIGPFVGGLLLATMGEAFCFLVNALTHLPVIAGLFLMRNLASPEPAKTIAVRDGIREGFRYAIGLPPVYSLLLFMCLVSVMGMQGSVVLPAIVEDLVHAGPDLYGEMTGATGVGAILAGVYLAMRKTIAGIGVRIVLAGFVYGGGMLLFTWTKTPGLMLSILAITGFALMLIKAGGNIVLQTLVSEEMRGRVMSFYTMAVLGTAPFGSLIAGAIAQFYGPLTSITVSGICCIAGSAAFAWMLPFLRQEAMEMVDLAAADQPLGDALETPAEFPLPPTEMQLPPQEKT
ncbi:MFS transporter [Blastopirellula sp. JC732]|uniref:MFS transporter n=1 Tax=Blastopirellula sediminis TaxID=2894196 RepID=A0A9X1MPQ8_9BACT|nr:MFS transporter [Blastopirellula sediminis]MCC9607363.1 MFS transporter [Blastopirellula sediminis]MCC9629344.1 MFS transporter [Blastopirellula sediminis]